MWALFFLSVSSLHFFVGFYFCCYVSARNFFLSPEFGSYGCLVVFLVCVCVCIYLYITISFMATAFTPSPWWYQCSSSNVHTFRMCSLFSYLSHSLSLTLSLSISCWELFELSWANHVSIFTYCALPIPNKCNNILNYPILLHQFKQKKLQRETNQKQQTGQKRTK